MKNQEREGCAVGKIVLQELKKTLEETGERLQEASAFEVFMATPFLGAGFIFLLFVSASVFLSSISKS